MSGLRVSKTTKKFAMKDWRPVVEALLLVHTKAASLALKSKEQKRFNVLEILFGCFCWVGKSKSESGLERTNSVLAQGGRLFFFKVWTSLPFPDS